MYKIIERGSGGLVINVPQIFQCVNEVKTIYFFQFKKDKLIM